MTILVIALLICVLIVTTLIAYVGRKTRKRRERNGDGPEKSDILISLAIALVATFVGVFAAFNLSNMQVERSERENLGSLIGQSIDELNLEVTHLEGLQERIKDMEEQESISMLNLNPIEDVVSVEFLISNQMFPKYCTQMGTLNMLRLVRDKEKMREGINNAEREFEHRLFSIDRYREYIEDLRDLLVLERGYVNREISFREVAEGLDKLHYVDTRLVSSK